MIFSNKILLLTHIMVWPQVSVSLAAAHMSYSLTQAEEEAPVLVMSLSWQKEQSKRTGGNLPWR